MSLLSPGCSIKQGQAQLHLVQVPGEAAIEVTGRTLRRPVSELDSFTRFRVH